MNLKPRILLNPVIPILILGIFIAKCDNDPGHSVQQITYERSDELFPNPERGFYVRYSTTPGGPVVDPEVIRRDRMENHITVIGRAYNIPEFRDSEFTPEFLNQIEEDFNAIREAGVKTYVRFRYTNRIGGEDAPPDRVLSQIEQLKLVFERNYDVIAFIQAGFIGAWGEWHASTNDLNLPENMRAIQFQLLDALPEERAVVVRSPRHKMNIFETNQPISVEQAFDGTRIARTGHHNDCFLADETDVGTYTPERYPEFDNEEALTIDGIKAYLSKENRYLPMGGETCNPRPGVTERFECETALAEMDQLHWSYLHQNYSRQILDTWEEQGCMPEVQRRLGYRFVMTDGAFSEQALAGGTFRFNLNLINEGFAAPYNPRGIELVLRNTDDHDVIHTIELPEDPRFWSGGEAVSLIHTLPVPENISRGSYELLLHLPDPVPALHSRPEYAIRLGNRDTWEPETGFNKLGHVIQISR